LPALVGTAGLNHTDRGNRARVDQRVAGALLILFDGNDRVERHTSGLNTDFVADGFDALLFHDQRRGEGLGNRLDRKSVPHIARGVNLAFGSYDDHTKQV